MTARHFLSALLSASREEPAPLASLHMDWFTNLIWHEGKPLGIEWHFWKVIGWLGNLVFFSRFFVQWHATEKQKKVVVPASFWWLSLTGSLLLLTYSIYQRDSVFIFAYLFTWIPYIRNLVIANRHAKAHRICSECGDGSPPSARFCASCGVKMAREEETAERG